MGINFVSNPAVYMDNRPVIITNILAIVSAVGSSPTYPQTNLPLGKTPGLASKISTERIRTLG